MEEVDTESLLIALSHPLYEGEALRLVIGELCDRFQKLNEQHANIDDVDGAEVPSQYREAYAGIFLRLKSLDNLGSITIDCILSLLVNTTNSLTTTLRQDFIDYLQQNNQISTFEVCLNRFLDYYPQTESKTPQSDWSESDPYQHMAGVLCNFATIQYGREFLLNPSKEYFKKLVVQIRSRNPVRRRGSVATVRSCLFETSTHHYILNTANILPHILYPIIVAKPFTEEEKEGMDPILWMQAANPAKVAEDDPEILKMIIECLLLLCQEAESRNIMRQRKVLYIGRNLDDVVDLKEDVREMLSDVVIQLNSEES